MKTMKIIPLAATLTALGAACCAVSVQAQTLRLFTPQSSGYFEVIEGSRTAGGFVRQNRGSILGHAIVGYTDRVSRGETIITYIGDRGIAQLAGVKVNGQVRAQVPNLPLPLLFPKPVSLNPNDDNIYAFATINGVYYEKRVPVGTR